MQKSVKSSRSDETNEGVAAERRGKRNEKDKTRKGKGFRMLFPSPRAKESKKKKKKDFEGLCKRRKPRKRSRNSRRAMRGGATRSS